MTETLSPRFDVVSLGEAMLRLSVPLGKRLDDTRTLDLEVAGAECNVCYALARLDRHVGWVSRVPEHSLGQNVIRALRADGVDVSAVRLVPNERIGTYFIEYASQPRSIQVIYDRADSAAARMTVNDVDWDYLLDTRILHLTGITAAVSESCYEIVNEAVRRARAANVLLSFDVNHRAKLWDATTAGKKLRPLIEQADILFCKSNDARLLFGCEGAPLELVRGLQELTQAQAIYCTFGADGATLLTQDEFVTQPAVPVHIVDRIGSGDAFAAGVLDALLDDDTSAPPAERAYPAEILREGLRRGVALAAIALSQFGDRVLTNRKELDAVLAQDKHDISR
jgi:2-dehydro-3-deoxygluconokinase